MGREVGAEERLTEKLKSRKFWLSQQVIVLACVMPIVYQRLGISESVTLFVLGLVGGVGGLYGVANVWQKRIESSSHGESES